MSISKIEEREGEKFHTPIEFLSPLHRKIPVVVIFFKR